MLKVAFKGEEVLRFVSKVQLASHHSAKDVDFLWKAEPLRARDPIEAVRKKAHDFEVALYGLGHSRVKNLDGQGGGRESRRGIIVVQDRSNQLVRA